MEQNQGKKKIRVNYYIDKHFQTKFILSFVAVIVFGLLVTLGVLTYYSQTKFKGGIYTKQETEIVKTEDGKLMAKPTRVMTFNRFELFWQPVVLVSAFYIVLIIIFGLFYSHRLAGPLYRIESDIKSYLDGDDTVQVHLRKNDFFQTLADLINKVLKKK